MSASRMPVLSPIAAKPSARLHEVVDLPTPPLPEATAMTCFMPGMPAALEVARACRSGRMADTACSSRSERIAFLRIARAQIILGGHDLFRTSRFAKPTLHAQAFGKSKHRAVGIVRERARRTGGDAGMAERAALDIEVDAAERRPRRQRHDIDRRGRGEMQFAKCSLEHAAFGAPRDQPARALRRDPNRGC